MNTPATTPAPQKIAHELKTWPPYFGQVLSGAKTFEVRKNDRAYKVGDELWLREWDPSLKEYSGRELRRTISYMLAGGSQFGIEDGTCVLALAQPTHSAQEAAELPKLPWHYANSHEPMPRRLWDEDDMRDFAAECLKDANDLCRSALAIAERDGKETNWEPFRKKLTESLHRQHAIMYRDQTARHFQAVPAQKRKTPRDGGTTNCVKCGKEISQSALCAECWSKAAFPAQSPGSGEALRVLEDLMKCLGATSGVRLLPENRVALEFQMGGYDGLVAVRERARAALAQPATPPLTSGSEPDGKVSTLVEFPSSLNANTRKLVKGFAAALADKLAKAEQKYGYSDGWMESDWVKSGECAKKLHDHAAKGDPRDVAAYCAFLWYHHATTVCPPLPSIGDGKDGERLDAIEAGKLNLNWHTAPDMGGNQWMCWPAGTSGAKAKRTRTARAAIDAAMSAQSPQAGREEK